MLVDTIESAAVPINCVAVGDDASVVLVFVVLGFTVKAVAITVVVVVVVAIGFTVVVVVVVIGFTVVVIVVVVVVVESHTVNRIASKN